MPTYLNDRIPFAPGTPLEVVACVGENELSGVHIHMTTYTPEGGKFHAITLGYEKGFSPFEDPLRWAMTWRAYKRRRGEK